MGKGQGEVTEQVVKLLATRVRVITVQQLANWCFSAHAQPLATARRWSRKLARAGMLRVWPAMVRHLELPGPLLRWSPENEIPDFGKLAWKNQKRWQLLPPTKTLCLSSTARANALYGGYCRQPRDRELEHDVNVAGVWFQLQQRAPAAAASWLHEDHMPVSLSLRPDALLELGTHSLVLEILGSGYSQPKIEATWKHFREHQLEFW